MTHRPWFWLAVVALLGLAWATRYQYATVRGADSSTQLLRTNRFTGHTQVFAGRWVTPVPTSFLPPDTTADPFAHLPRRTK